MSRSRAGDTTRMRAVAWVALITLIASACGGGDDTASSEGSGTIAGDQVVIDPEDLAAAREKLENEAEEAELASAADSGLAESDAAEDAADDETGTEPAEDEIEVAEAEEDELDGLLNSLNVFTSCLDESGYSLDGFPGDGSGRTAEDFDPAYLQALGACAAESGIQDAQASFADAQANLTPEEIEANNFGLPVFKECMEDLGWIVEDLVPNERGQLGFGETGFGLQPPGGGGIDDFNTDDINTCRLEAEQYVAENFEASVDSSS